MQGESASPLLLDRSADDAMERGGAGECHHHHHPLSVFLRDARLAFRWDELGQEIMKIAVPGALALMADPVASLVDTAFIGHIGPVELGAVGVSIAVFNQVSRIAVFPLVSVTTSFVAEEDAMSNGRDNDKINQENECNVSASEMEELISPEGASATTRISSFETDSCEVSVEQKRTNIPSVSTALLLGGVLGLLETLLLVLSAKPILGYMGVKPDSAMMKPALQYLVLRSLGAPAVLLSLATQGVFRGFKDTKTPLYATGREKGKSKSVSFALLDASGVATPTDTNSEMGNIGDSCNDKLTDENLSNSSQQMAEKHFCWK